MRTPKWLYRLEAEEQELGLWYNGKGEYVELIKEIPNCVSAHLPMGYDDRYQKDGKKWYSSTSSLAQMPYWFSKENAQALIAKGFRFYRYLAVDYVEYELETTMLKESALHRVEMSLDEIYTEEVRVT